MHISILIGGFFPKEKEGRTQNPNKQQSLQLSYYPCFSPFGRLQGNCIGWYLRNISHLFLSCGAWEVLYKMP